MFDVSVIGAGPAGCAAAISLAKSGFSVCIFARSPKQRPQLGEMLPPEIQPVLEELGAWASFEEDGHRPVEGISSIWGSSERSETDFVFSPYGKGWTIDREKFDRTLLATAKFAGVTVFERSEVLHVEFVESARWRVRLSCDRAMHTVAADFVLQATGRSSVAGLKSKRIYADKSVAVIMVATGERNRGDRPLIEASESGWWYSTVLPNGELVIIYNTDASRARQSGATAQDVLVGDLQHAPQTRSRVNGGSCRSVSLVSSCCSLERNLAGNGWFRAGDAARTYDPLCGQGILQSLNAGISAAQAISKGSEDVVQNYIADIERMYFKHLLQRRRYYRYERRWPNSSFWRARQIA